MNPILLIVDDDSAVREGLKLALELKGYEVALAADAESAIDWLTTLTPALVILDCQLPELMRPNTFGASSGNSPSSALARTVTVKRKCCKAVSPRFGPSLWIFGSSYPRSTP